VISSQRSVRSDRVGVASWTDRGSRGIAGDTPIVLDGRVTGDTPGTTIRSGRDTDTVTAHW